MEPTDSRPTAILPPGLGSPTDPLICSLLAAEPMTSPEVAARLAIPARTVRHRLMRLRDAGAVTVGEDGVYRVASPGVEALPTVAAPGLGLAAPSTPPAAAWSPAELVAAGAIAAFCAGVAIWAARRAATQQPSAAVTATPPASLAWPYGLGWSGVGGRQVSSRGSQFGGGLRPVG